SSIPLYIPPILSTYHHYPECNLIDDASVLTPDTQGIPGDAMIIQNGVSGHLVTQAFPFPIPVLQLVFIPYTDVVVIVAGLKRDRMNTNRVSKLITDIKVNTPGIRQRIPVKYRGIRQSRFYIMRQDLPL